MTWRPFSSRGSRVRLLGEVEKLRTGGVKLDWDFVNEITSRVLATFEPCGKEMFKPSEETKHSSGDFYDHKTGRKKMLPVVIKPAPVDDALIVSGRYLGVQVGRSEWFSRIEITPRRGLCMPLPMWVAPVRAAVVHEMTHAADPGIGKQRKHYDLAKLKAGEVQYDTYVNDPGEVKAHLNQMRSELQQSDARYMIARMKASGDARPDKVLRLSSTWRTMKPFLSEENKRLYYRMAARILEG